MLPSEPAWRASYMNINVMISETFPEHDYKTSVMAIMGVWCFIHTIYFNKSLTGVKHGLIWSVLTCWPHLELLFPLLHRHTWVAQHECSLTHRATSSHTHQTLASTTRQDYHTRASTAVTKHLAQTLLLVWSQHCWWFQVNAVTSSHFICMVMYSRS